MAPTARSTPFLCSCAKKRGGAPKKRAFGCRHGSCSVPPASPTNSKPQHHRRLRQADFAWPINQPASNQLDAPIRPVGASSSWERRVGPNSSRGGTQKRVSLGLHPVSLRKSKEMGWNGQQGGGASAQENGAHVKGANKVPPFLWLCTCAPIRWEVVVSFCCDSTPFLWCLPKETVSSRQRKALFYLGVSTIRVSATSRWPGRSSPDLGEGAGAVFFGARFS